MSTQPTEDAQAGVEYIPVFAASQPDPAYSVACHVATALFKKHFAHLPDFASGQAVWSLCDSTAGVISQIDNMVAGLVRPPTTSPQADSVQEDAARLDFIAVHGSFGVDSATGELGGNGQKRIAATRKNIDAARKQGATQ